MPTLKVKKPFKWAHRHVDVKEYKPGDVIETDDKDLVRVATEEGWATAGKATAKTDAPEPKTDAVAPDKSGAADQDPQADPLL